MTNSIPVLLQRHKVCLVQTHSASDIENNKKRKCDNESNFPTPKFFAAEFEGKPEWKILEEDLKRADPSDYQIIRTIFKTHKKTYFPHIRDNYLKDQIDLGNIIFQDGVVIIYNVYKRRQQLGDSKFMAMKGDTQIKQIVNKNQGNGNAHKIFKKFLNKQTGNIWLTVRKENFRAINFYSSMGMTQVGNINWSNGKIPGAVFYISSSSIEK